MGWRVFVLAAFAWGFGWGQSGGNDAGQAKELLRRATSMANEGRTEEAAAALEKALTALKRTPGSPRTEAIALNNLGLAQRDLGQHAKAEQRLLRAVGLIERSSSKDDPILIAFLNNLALVYQDQSQSGRAERCLRRALKILEAAEPRRRFDEATTLNALGVNLLLQERRGEGTEVLERALAAWELVPDSKEVLKSRAMCQLNVAVAHAAIGRLEEAAREQAPAVSTIERLTPVTHPEFVKALILQGNILGRAGDLAGAEQRLRRAADLANMHQAGNSLLRGRALAEYSDVLRHMGRGQEAKAVSREAKEAMAQASQEAFARHTVDYSDLMRQAGKQ